ncbi:photosystem II stability/assembly factor HCF136 [Populus alba x Populus x berolinensis]|nr:photosystem II stability/assembly factor HCF136 [Populus alba x Populus x berolinensis]
MFFQNYFSFKKGISTWHGNLTPENARVAVDITTIWIRERERDRESTTELCVFRERGKVETMASLTSPTFTTNTRCLQRPQNSHSPSQQPRLSQRPELNRRHFISQTASLSSLPLLSPLILNPQQANAAAEDSLSEWERVYLPIDPGVVLLDIAFVPDDTNHGFLLGTRQTIMETKDGGNTWVQRSIPSAEDEDFNYRFNSISFKGKEGWIVGKPAILLYTADSGETWERIPLSAQLPGDMVYIKATEEKSAEMVTDEGAIYVTSNRGYNWRAAVQESVSATLNRTVSSGISGASYYTGTFNTVNRSPNGNYVAVSSRGNFYLTWEPGQAFWQPHNRAIARRIQNMGWRADGGLWLLVRGGGLYLSKGIGISEEFEEIPVQSRGFGILDVGYRSKEEAWAAGGSGILLRTTNGGKTWTRDKAADNIAANLYSVKFIDDKKGFVLGNDGVLLRYLG